jgi:hypothetical protein
MLKCCIYAFSLHQESHRDEPLNLEVVLSHTAKTVNKRQAKKVSRTLSNSAGHCSTRGF